MVSKYFDLITALQRFTGHKNVKNPTPISSVAATLIHGVVPNAENFAKARRTLVDAGCDQKLLAQFDSLEMEEQQ